MVKAEYRKVSVWLHWLIFLLFVIALTCIELRGMISHDSAWRAPLRNWHIDAGLLVFLFALWRITARLRYGGPKPIGARWQAAAASALHGVLYLVMFLLPITGILFSQAGGRDVALFGWHVPVLIGADPDVARQIKAIHEFLGNSVYYLVGLHILAALWHHFVLKDETLRRMKPR